MVPKSTHLPVFLLAVGCAGQALPPAMTSRPRSDSASAELARPAEMSRAQPERGPRAELGLPPGAAFETERQIAELEVAIALYTQFLERATGRPELEPAVKKARERIADAQQTIVFLEN